MNGEMNKARQVWKTVTLIKGYCRQFDFTDKITDILS